MLNGELCSETDFCLRHDMENKKRWAAFLRQCVGRPIVTPSHIQRWSCHTQPNNDYPISTTG